MSRFRDFVSDAGEVLIVEYSAKGGRLAVISLPWLSEPEDPPEVEIVGAWRKADEDNADAPAVSLTDAEIERFTGEVCDDPSTYEVDYDD